MMTPENMFRRWRDRCFFLHFPAHSLGLTSSTLAGVRGARSGSLAVALGVAREVLPERSATARARLISTSGFSRRCSPSMTKPDLAEGKNLFVTHNHVPGDLARSRRMISTIAFQLAFQSRLLGSFVCDALREDPNLGDSASLSEQYHKLLLHPLQSAELNKVIYPQSKVHQ
jgi:hypothetical protein